MLFFDEVDVIHAIIELIRNAKGSRISFKARTLLNYISSGTTKDQSTILRIARICNMLVKAGFLKAEVSRYVSKKRVSKVLRYYVDNKMLLWTLAKQYPEKAISLIRKALALQSIL